MQPKRGGDATSIDSIQSLSSFRFNKTKTIPRKNILFKPNSIPETRYENKSSNFPEF